MQAIQTKYIGPTNSRGARIKASCAALTITVPYDYGAICAHEVAAIELCKRMDWAHFNLAAGELKDGSHVFVLIGMGDFNVFRVADYLTKG